MGYFTQVYKVRDLLERDSIHIVLQPRPCITFPPCEKADWKVIAAVVSQVRLLDDPYEDCPGVYHLDRRYVASYKILQPILGNYKQNDTLTFEVFDHYGSPAFADYQNVLIYICDYCGRLVHVKYQYNNVYITEDGRWAAPYQTHDYMWLAKSGKTTTVKPELITFKKPVMFNLDGYAPEVVKQQFPEPYYKIEGNKAIAVYGNYIEELLEIKKLTRLKEYDIKP
jgi:hypothetical protein